jgi:uncharacterized protein
LLTISWVIKASKLCDLRCRYCYEWEELGSPERISLWQWRALLTAIRQYHDLQTARRQRSVQSLIVWHGGEPLLLPDKYFREVLELQRTILGRDALGRGDFRNVLQTNLYHLNESKLDLFAEFDLGIGVSLDVVPGVRLDRTGRETEERVVTNMDRLRERGIPFGAIAVLAGHTQREVINVYDFFETLDVPVRFLPLFDSPSHTEGSTYATTSPQIVLALNELFVHWMERGCRISVKPLEDYLENVLRHMTTLEVPLLNRRDHGDSVIIVNTDGNIFQVIDAYIGPYDPTRALGNVFHEPIERILSSSRFKRSLKRSDDLIRGYCAGCRFLGACDTGPVQDTLVTDSYQGCCPVAFPVHEFIETYLLEQGFTPQVLRDLVPFEELLTNAGQRTPRLSSVLI